MTQLVNILTEPARSHEREMTQCLSRNLLATRRGFELSQDQLARRSGVSKGTIVQIEQGRGNPSIGSLWRLAAALGLSVEDLVSAARPADARIAAAASAKTLWRGPRGGTGKLLIGTSGPDMLEFWHWRLAPGERHESAGHSPGTREILNIAKGALRLELGGRSYEIGAGSSIAFAADERHAYACKGKTPTVFAMVVDEPGALRSKL
jgi:transcriptional regulator with XRE-family HTH domain